MIPIIQTSIIGTEHISVLSAEDAINATSFGYQVTPQSLISLYNSSIMDSVISSTVSGKLSDKQPYLWTLDQVSLTSVDASIFNSSSFNDIPKEQFIASFPVGTDTGVLRDLALRLNISVGCTLVPQSDFPSTCPGDYPLSQTFSNINVSNPNVPRYRARICAPGNVGYSPWKDTADRQDISEEFWLDYEDGGSNYTQHCYGNSTLGYFELPNYWNGHVAGPLLNTVPPNSPNLTYQNGNPSETTARPTPLHTEDVQDYSGTPGPFLTAIMAIFGPNTFFSTVAANSNWTSTYTTKALCSQLSYPFTCFAYYFAYNAIVGDFRTSWTPSAATPSPNELAPQLRQRGFRPRGLHTHHIRRRQRYPQQWKQLLTRLPHLLLPWHTHAETDPPLRRHRHRIFTPRRTNHGSGPPSVLRFSERDVDRKSGCVGYVAGGS